MEIKKGKSYQHKDFKWIVKVNFVGDGIVDYETIEGTHGGIDNTEMFEKWYVPVGFM